MTSTTWKFRLGTKVPSVWGVGGGINIFWNHTIFILSLLCLRKLLIIRC